MTIVLREEPLRSEPGETLDPESWDDLRAQGHRMLDDMFDYIANIRERLFQAFGDRQTMETRSAAEGGFSIIIEIPLILEDQPRVAA